MKDRLIVALDVSELAEARSIVGCLPEALWFKVGLQAFLGFGPALIAWLHERRRRIFLDLKFKDIPHTVAGAVTSALSFRPSFLTIHCSGGGGMIRSAVEAAAVDPDLTLLGVTVLTSLADSDLRETGVDLPAEEAVLRLVELGLKNGLRAFVCSPREIEPIRRRFGAEPQLVIPGIRPQWAESGDQKRVFTPARAVAAGADWLVVGRPLTQAADPGDAFARLVLEMENGRVEKGRQG
jgi:orotidine-5'-phosphate decarboxylase